MAVLAIGGDAAGGRYPGMHAVRVCILRIGMAAPTKHFLWRCVVRKGLDVLVAVHACKLHRAVNGMLELLPIHKQRDLLAIYVFGQGVVAVASEAVFVFRLMLGAIGESRAQQKDRERTEQDSAGNFHD